MPPTKSSTPFEKDEKVLCFHGPYLYEAKVLDVEPIDAKDKKSGYRFQVHYKGWKNTWDDWVMEDRLRKLTDENKELARTLMQDMKQRIREEKQAKRAGNAPASAKKKSDGRIALSEERGTPASNRGTKRTTRDWDNEKEAEFKTYPAIRIPMPDHLKGLLVDDWENVTKNLQLVPVPHPHPVTEILEAYRGYEAGRRRPGSAEEDFLNEVVEGIKEYFDKTLGRILLYRHEREQWMEVNKALSEAPVDDEKSPSKRRKKSTVVDDNPEHLAALRRLAGKQPSDAYGAEHLCRLFVSLPELVAQTNMDTQSVTRLKEELAKLTYWLSKNASNFFVKSYITPGKDYANE